jgi:hypothetical protein
MSERIPGGMRRSWFILEFSKPMIVTFPFVMLLVDYR